MNTTTSTLRLFHSRHPCHAGSALARPGQHHGAVLGDLRAGEDDVPCFQQHTTGRALDVGQGLGVERRPARRTPPAPVSAAASSRRRGRSISAIDQRSGRVSIISLSLSLIRSSIGPPTSRARVPGAVFHLQLLVDHDVFAPGRPLGNRLAGRSERLRRRSGPRRRSRRRVILAVEVLDRIGSRPRTSSRRRRTPGRRCLASMPWQVRHRCCCSVFVIGGVAPPRGVPGRPPPRRLPAARRPPARHGWCRHRAARRSRGSARPGCRGHCGRSRAGTTPPWARSRSSSCRPRSSRRACAVAMILPGHSRASVVMPLRLGSALHLGDVLVATA